MCSLTLSEHQAIANLPYAGKLKEIEVINL